MDRLTEHRVTCTVTEMDRAVAALGRFSAGVWGNGAEMHVNALGDSPEVALARLVDRFGRFAADGLEALQRQLAEHGMPPVEWRRCPACDRRRLVAEGADPKCPEPDCSEDRT